MEEVEHYQDIELCISNILETIGNDIKLGIPLGIGKPNHFVNAFYNRAKKNPQINLIILTALTLERPKGKSDLEERFLAPLRDRLFGDYPDLDYELDRSINALPENVRVIEFYFPAGKFNNNKEAQRNYTSTNYTHVARDLIDRGVNVIAQLVAPSESGGRVSLSCNPDVSLDLRAELTDRTEVAFVGQVTRSLPYMFGDADVAIETFDHIIDNPTYDYALFAPPKGAISEADYMIGFHASTLVKDGGELQIGIGALGDSLVYALLLRHSNNEIYKELIYSLEIEKKNPGLLEKKGGKAPFENGLFGASEMFVDGFMYLIKEGILKRKVYDHPILQRLINQNLIQEDKVDKNTLLLLLSKGAFEAKLEKADFDFMQKFGILRKELKFAHGQIHFPTGEVVEADLNIDQAQKTIIEKGLGKELKNGAIVHGGFFLGAADFYQWLHELPESERRMIHMKSVRSINQLYGHEEIDRLHRKNGRFINTCLKMTLLGAAVSDGLEDGTVISGVGGQYNFVEMAHALPDGHSIIQLRATRTSKGKTYSNIVWNYGHITIPRHLKDIVITEYGIADIRGKTDEEVIIELIKIADSRFQNELIDVAKKNGKLSEDFVLDSMYSNNYPETLTQILSKYKSQGLFQPFPFGSDFTDQELVLGKALKSLKAKTSTPFGMLTTVLKSLFKKPSSKHLPLLKRMNMDKTHNFKEKLYQKLLIYALG